MTEKSNLKLSKMIGENRKMIKEKYMLLLLYYQIGGITTIVDTHRWGQAKKQQKNMKK